MKHEKIEAPALAVPMRCDVANRHADALELMGIQRERMDRFVRASVARLTMGVSPAALGMAIWTGFPIWFRRRASSSNLLKGGYKWVRLARYAAVSAASPDCEPCIEPLPYDKRFSGGDWNIWPFNLVSQGFLLSQQWWQTATTGVRGVSPHHEAIVSFVGRQMLDMLSPSNNPFLNPEILRRTMETGGANFRHGLANWSEDVERLMRNLPPVGAVGLCPGEGVAVTPGKVVFRNRVMELI